MGKQVFDIHHDSKALIGLANAAIVSNTDTSGAIIDRAGFMALEFLLQMGTITDGAYAVKLEHGDLANLSDAADVDAAEQLGDADFAVADDDSANRIGYIGKKRYVRLVITSTGVTTGVDAASAMAMLANAIHQPSAD